MGEPERGQLPDSGPQPPARMKPSFGCGCGRPTQLPRTYRRGVEPGLPPSLLPAAGRATEPRRGVNGLLAVGQGPGAAVRPGRALRVVPEARVAGAPVGWLKGTRHALKSRRNRGLSTSPHPQTPASSEAATSVTRSSPDLDWSQERVPPREDGCSHPAGGAGAAGTGGTPRSAGGSGAQRGQPPW